MGARYYDPVIGRFLSMDPVEFSEANPASFNRYAYANNNPYMYFDPDGESPKLIVDFALNVGINYITTGEANLKGAATDALVNAVNPLATLNKAKKIAKIVDGKGGKERIRVKDVTDSSSREPNFEINKTKSQFEQHLKQSGLSQKDIGTKKGNISVFSKDGKKEFTTRGFSRSTNGASGEMFSGGKRTAKIRFKKE